MTATRGSTPGSIDRGRYVTFRRFVMAWTVACFIVGGLASWQAMQLRQGAVALDRAGVGLERTAASLRKLDELPFVGEQVSDAAGSVERGGKSARASAADARTAVTILALALGLSIAFLPTLPLLVVVWLLEPAGPRPDAAPEPQ